MCVSAFINHSLHWNRFLEGNEDYTWLYLIPFSVCSGHRGFRVPLLGLVRRPRRFRRSGGRLPPPSAPHRLPAPGRHRGPAQHGLAAPDRPGRGGRQQPLPPRKHAGPSPSADAGLLAARRHRNAGLPEQHPASASLLHGEEDPAREPGGGGHRERLQGNGETQVHGSNECQPSHLDIEMRCEAFLFLQE